MQSAIPDAKVLITVKAYPKPSGKYGELVCTAGLLNGEEWIRIYPVPFRLLHDRRKYPKYAWIQLNLERRADFRPESYRPSKGIQEEITVLHKIPTTDKWRERKSLILRNVYYSMDQLISDAYSDRNTSLATLKPTEVLQVKAKPAKREWPTNWKEYLIQNDLFQTAPSGKRQIIRKVPYDFSYVFRTRDGKVRTLKIEDWELGALYWNCLSNANGDETEAAAMVRRKYESFSRHDIYLFLGTTLQYHRRKVPNPFIVIGVFYPPHDPQMDLFAYGHAASGWASPWSAVCHLYRRSVG